MTNTNQLTEKTDIIPILLDTLSSESGELTYEELDTLTTDIRRLSPEMNEIFTDILFLLGEGHLDLSFLDDLRQSTFNQG